MMDPQLWTIFAVFSALCGACVGSFLNVCIYRIPLDMSVVKPRSHCMTCGRLIPWYHNLPVVSYFILRGKCAYCKAPYSFRYAGVELLTSFLFTLIFCMLLPFDVAPPFGITRLAHIAEVPVLWLFAAGLIVGTFVDFDHFILPDSVTIGGMFAGLILSALVPSLHGQVVWWQGLALSAIGLAAGFVPLQAIRLGGTYFYRKRGRIEKDEYAMGFGDIKLIGAVGAFLGWQGALFGIAGAALFGTLVAIPLLIFGRRKLLDRIPFGPYISLAALVWMFWGPRIVTAYWRILLMAHQQ